MLACPMNTNTLDVVTSALSLDEESEHTELFVLWFMGHRGALV